MTIAIANAQKGSTSAGTTVTTTAFNSSASGSSFLAVLGWDFANTFSSISDNMGNSASYSLVGTEINSGTGNQKGRAYLCTNGAGGTGHTFTINITGSGGITAFFVEITGGVTASILDQSNDRNDSTSPYTLAAGLTTTQAIELLVTGLIGNSGSNPATHAETGLGSSTINIEETNGASFWTGGIASVRKTATGTFNPSWTESGSADGLVWLLTLKEAAATVYTPFTQKLSFANDIAIQF